MSTARVTAIVTAHARIPETLATLKKLYDCVPAPAEVLVHVDGGRDDCASAVRQKFPAVVFVSNESVGPGGGRNKLLRAALFEYVASFDDDSYPIDEDYFARLTAIFAEFPEAAVIASTVFERGQSIGVDAKEARIVADFPGGGCAYRRSKFLATSGYVPLSVAYGCEEVDLALRLHAAGSQIVATRWLRVFHDTDLGRHAAPSVTSASIANIALLAYLRYPLAAWPIGALQCTNRIVWLLRNSRRRGILAGILSIPAHLWRHRGLRSPVSWGSLRSYLTLRRAPFVVAWN